MVRGTGTTRRTTRRAAFSAFALTAAMGLAACGGGDEPPAAAGGGGGEAVDMGSSLLEDSDQFDALVEAAREEGSAVIYGSQEEVIYDDLLAAWEERFPDIEIELVYYSGADEWERILAEISAGVAEIDGITPTVQNPVDAIDIGAFDETVDWTGLGVPETALWEDDISVVWGHQVGGIAYSTERVEAEQVPDTWEGCADEEWAGEFVVDTRPSFPFALVDALGEEPLMDLMQTWKDNDPVFRRGQTATVETLAAGEYAFLCGSGYDAFRKVESEGGAVGWQWVDPVPAFPRRGFVMAEAASPSVATLWYLFLFTEDAQQVMDQIGNSLITEPFCACYDDVKDLEVSIASDEDLAREGEINDRIVSEVWQVIEE